MTRKIRLAGAVCGLTVLLISGCDRADRERAQQKADQAAQKAQDDARKLGNEARQEAQKLNRKVGDELNGRSSSTIGTTAEAEQKLKHAGQIARAEGEQASKRLGQAGLLAQVKARLVSEVGLATVANIQVDVSGQVVTLRGTVSSEDQKRQAERVVSQLDGVKTVVNDLTVQP